MARLGGWKISGAACACAVDGDRTLLLCDMVAWSRDNDANVSLSERRRRRRRISPLLLRVARCVKSNMHAALCHPYPPCPLSRWIRDVGKVETGGGAAGGQGKGEARAGRSSPPASHFSKR